MEVSKKELQGLATKVSYGGNAEHKSNPGDFGLPPPFGPRRGKTLCDGVKIFEKAKALELLKKGILMGLVSEQRRNGFPKNIWAVADDGTALEAALDNQTTGSYHGYPMWRDDQFGAKVVEKWNKIHE